MELREAFRRQSMTDDNDLLKWQVNADKEEAK